MSRCAHIKCEQQAKKDCTEYYDMDHIIHKLVLGILCKEAYIVRVVYFWSFVC